MDHERRPAMLGAAIAMPTSILRNTWLARELVQSIDAQKLGAKAFARLGADRDHDVAAVRPE